MTCRIDLKQTNYKTIDFEFLSSKHFDEGETIYKRYIQHKQFDSVFPIFREEWDIATIFGYYHKDKLVAWSAYYEFPSKKTVHADQFAWDYENPNLKLGYKSIRSECAYYKAKGFEYLVLGDTDMYKQELQGYEIITLDSKSAFDS